MKPRAALGPLCAAIAPSARHVRCTTTVSVCGVASSAWNLALQVVVLKLSAAGQTCLWGRAGLPLVT